CCSAVREPTRRSTSASIPTLAACPRFDSSAYAATVRTAGTPTTGTFPTDDPTSRARHNKPPDPANGFAFFADHAWARDPRVSQQARSRHQRRGGREGTARAASRVLRQLRLARMHSRLLAARPGLSAISGACRG